MEEKDFLAYVLGNRVMQIIILLFYFWFSYQASEETKLDLFAVTASFAKFGQDDDFPPRYCRACFWWRGALLPPPFPLLLPGYERGRPRPCDGGEELTN